MSQRRPNKTKVDEWTEVDQIGPKWTEYDRWDQCELNRTKVYKIDRSGPNG